MSHATRAALASKYPVHVTTRLVAGLDSLRSPGEFGLVLRACEAGCDRFGFRLVEFSVQSNHLHLIAEARDRHALSRGMQGLLIRIAKRLNRWWDRQGRVFADRYHARILRSPRQVRNALLYVLSNDLRHRCRLARDRVDRFSSARWFAGWREHVPSGPGPRPTMTPRAWMLDVGWRKHGRLSVNEAPG